VFENRFQHAPELARMGARVHVDGGSARVDGPTELTGAAVMATDLRASACLVLAGVAAAGTTVVHRIYHLDRGYEGMELKLQGLGAHVARVAESMAS
jgi:UDP-N-acetylglucosamine 1-carboxyvinyltransferase